MKLGCKLHLSLVLCLVTGALAENTLSAFAQIAGDGTLDTRVNGSPTAPCTATCFITNGSQRGSNLFHSFRQFSLPNGNFAGFITTPDIQNVIVRVTGVEQSTINGAIATVNSTAPGIAPANFFLINPKGIVFGPRAQLIIGGSFLATTAERMVFQDGTVLSTHVPTPLLTVSVPIGLQFGQAPGEIQMQSSYFALGTTASFRDFALIGGNVSLEGTTLIAPDRHIELGWGD